MEDPSHLVTRIFRDLLRRESYRPYCGAKVDLRAINDYATSFGVVAMTRAYADWSVLANAAYRKDLVDLAVDLVQLFPASGTKNGADIRLAVDAVEDLTRHPQITHVALVVPRQGDCARQDGRDQEVTCQEGPVPRFPRAEAGH